MISPNGKRSWVGFEGEKSDDGDDDLDALLCTGCDAANGSGGELPILCSRGSDSLRCPRHAKELVGGPRAQQLKAGHEELVV